MSKLIMLPFVAAAAAPVVVAARVVKKVSDALGSLSSEDWHYLLPMGASKERLRLEQASVSHRPMEGIDFGGTLPDFGYAGTPVALPQLESVPALSFQQEEVLKSISPIVEEAGFMVRPRALPDGVNVAIFDLFHQRPSSQAVLVGESHGYKKD